MISARTVPLLRILACALAAWSPAKLIGSDPMNHHHGTSPLCELLETISPGEQRPATVRGILVLGFETNTLYDPESLSCPLDVQPTTEVEVSYRIPGTRRLEETAKRSEGRAYVTLRGVLWGPGRVNEDDMSDPLLVSYSRRAPARYGNLAYSRTKFVVDEVIESAPVPATVLSMGESFKPRPESAFPVLRAAAVPIYPTFARNMRITGEVIVDVTIKDGRPASTKVKAGDRALAQAVLENIGTWRFDESVTATLATKFEFVLELRKTGADRNSRLELNLPSAARIVAAENDW